MEDLIWKMKIFFAKRVIRYSASILMLQSSGHFPHELSACSADPAGVFYGLMLAQNVWVRTGCHKLPVRTQGVDLFLFPCSLWDPKARAGQRCSIRQVRTLKVSLCQRITGLSRVIPNCKVTSVIYSPPYQCSTFNLFLPRNIFQNLSASMIFSFGHFVPVMPQHVKNPKCNWLHGCVFGVFLIMFFNV